jgi:hypothetical protein
MLFKKNISPLEQAIVTGSLDDIKGIAEQGANLEMQLSSGKTPLFYAIDAGKTELVQLLIRRGVDIERRNDKNQTPLFAAVRLGRMEVAKELLALKADPNAHCGPQAQTPLFAVMEGYDGHLFTDVTILRTIVALLLANGADPTHQLTSGVTLLHGAAICDDLELLNLLLEQKLDVNAMAGGSPPIAILVRQGKPAMVARLVEAGARTDIRFPNGMTLLDFANRRGDRQILEALQGKLQQITKTEARTHASTDQTVTSGSLQETTSVKQTQHSTGGSWELVPMSGLIAGIISAFSYEKIQGPAFMLPAALAWGICILNRGFRFNFLQKAIATAVMLYITFEWRQLARLFMNH